MVAVLLQDFDHCRHVHVNRIDQGAINVENIVLNHKILLCTDHTLNVSIVPQNIL